MLYEDDGGTQKEPDSRCETTIGDSSDTPAIRRDPRLGDLAQVWDRLPEPIRAAIVAMVKAAT
jgi:hypothetical protein